MKYTHDYMSCPSNICETDPEKYLRNWYVDEEVCTSHPIRHWMRIQKRLHKLYLKGKIEKSNEYFTVQMLDDIVVVRSGIHGKKSDKQYKTSPRMGLSHA